MKSLWHKHPGVRTGKELTLGERAADHMREWMGSWTFVGAFILTMIIWAMVNSLLFGHFIAGKPFDPYPYVFLNLMLSMMAGLQGAILLISGKRSDQIASEVAVHTQENTEQIKELIKRNNELTEIIHDRIVQEV